MHSLIIFSTYYYYTLDFLNEQTFFRYFRSNFEILLVKSRNRNIFAVKKQGSRSSEGIEKASGGQPKRYSFSTTSKTAEKISTIPASWVPASCS